MACRISYNNDGQPTGVLNRNGQESQLFKEVLNHPMVENFDEALSLYKNTETSELYQKEENYSFSNRANGEVFFSYRDALNTEAGEIELGFFDNSGNFHPVKTIQPSLDPKTPKGFINLQVKQGIIGEQKVLKNGVAYFQPRGATQAGRGINDMILGDEALVNLGWRGFQRTPNGYTFLPYSSDYTPTGHEQIMEKEIKNIFAEVRSAKQTTEDGNQLNEQDLKLRLLDFLNNIGVNFMAISDYVEKYKIKNGVEPSAKALADISNQIIAIQNGEIDTDTLLEETSHFIVEGWEQSEIENLLRNIHRTPEWQQFSNEYREIYSREYTGDKIDQAVRREVLGKVLANSLKNNFSTEAAQGVQKSIIDRVRDFFNQFIDFLRGKTTQTLQDDLASFTEDVNDLLYQNQLESFINKDNFKGNNFKLYSTGSAKNVLKGMNVEISQTLKFLEQNIKQLRGTKGSFKSEQNKINRNIRELEDESQAASRQQAAIEMATIASSQVEYLNSLIKEGEANEQYLFGSQANAVYQTLVHNVSPLISSMKNNIENNKDEYPPKEWEKVTRQLDEIVKDIQDLRGKSNNIYMGTFNKIVDRIMVKHDLPEEYRANVKQWVETAQKDTSYFHRYFGQMVNSRDPLLGLASEIGERTHFGMIQESTPRLKQFQSFIRNLGVKEGDLKKLNDKGFLVDETDHGKIDEFVKTVSAETRKEVAPTTDSIEQIKEKARKRELSELSPDQKAAYTKRFKERMLEVQERFRTNEYYDELAKKHENIAPETINEINGYSADRMNIIRDIIDEDGVIDYSKLSLSDMEALKALARNRKHAKSPYNTLGELKTGLSETSNPAEIPAGVPQAEWNGVYYYINNAKQQEGGSGRVAIDLINLDEQFLKKIKEDRLKAEAEGIDTTEEIPQLFKDKVAEIERTSGREAAINFIEVNANIGFNQEFWNEVSPDGSYLDTISESIEDPDGLAIVANIRQLSNRRSSLLRQFQKLNKSFEVDANKMKGDTRDKIRELDSQIQAEYSSLLEYVEETPSGEEVSNEEELNPIYQSEVNEAYLDKVSDRDLDYKEELEFIYQNSTSEARTRVALFARAIKGYVSGRGGLTPSQEAFYENYANTPGVALGTEAVILSYARTQVASYYKRFVPQEYTEVFAQREVAKTAEDYLDALIEAKHIDVRPNYSFQDSQENFINPNYDPTYEGGYQMRKGNLEYNAPIFNEQGEVTGTETKSINFESEKFKDLFGVESNGATSKNNNLYQARQELLNLQRQSLENTDLTGRHNLYKAPQITVKGVDRGKFIVNNFSLKGAGQNLKELFTHRVDDVEYGQTIQGTDVSVVPVHYTQEIENANELSDEFFYSYAMMYQQSVLHKHRKNNIGEMLAIKDALEKRNSSQNAGVDAKNTMEMFDNYMNYAFFGKQETQEFKIRILGETFDVTKFARVLLNFVKLRNLASNPLIAATSWFTGEVNFQIEKRIGEILNPASTRLGTREFMKLAGDAIKETGNLESKSRLNVLREHFGIANITERYENSNYNWLARNSKHVWWGVHQAANFPIANKALLAVLYDSRVVGDEGNAKIVDYSKFKLDMRKANPEMTNKQILAEWAKTEDRAIYNYLDTENGSVTFKPGFRELLAPEIRTDEYVNTKMEGITQRAVRTNSQLDQQITEPQRVAAQRHFALNYLMTHRSWFSITLSNRFKNAHYNTSTGQYEEGTYRNFAAFAESVIKTFNSKGFIGSFKAAWRGDDIQKNGQVPKDVLLQTRRRSMRRVMLDTAWIMGMAAVGYLVLGFADDDEDNYTAQLAAYLMMRTLNETVSSSYAVPNQLYEAASSPFVGLGTVIDAMQFPLKVWDSDIIQSGKFKGETKGWKAMTEVIPGARVIGDLTNIRGTLDTYLYYNTSNINTSPAALFEVTGLGRQD